MSATFSANWRRSLLRASASLGDAASSERTYVSKCLARQRTLSQLLLLGIALRRQQLIDETSFRAFVAAVRREDRDAACRFLAQHLVFDTIVELDAALEQLNCFAEDAVNMSSAISREHLLLLAEALQRERRLNAEQVSAAYNDRAALCALITQQFESIAPLDAERSSGAERRLDSLLSVAEPRWPSEQDDSRGLFAAQRDALRRQKSLWPDAQSLLRDVDQACRQFVATSTVVGADTQQRQENDEDIETNDRTQALHQIAAAFYDAEAIDRVLLDVGKSRSAQAQFDRATDMLASALEPVRLSLRGEAALIGTLGEQRRQAVELCMLLAHPVVRGALQDVGPVQHLTDDVLRRLRDAERRRATQFERDVRERKVSWANWLWRQANAVLGSMSSVASRWNLTKALLLSAALSASAAATTTAPAQLATQPAMARVPAAAPEMPALVVSGGSRTSTMPPLAVQPSGFATPAQLDVRRAKQLFSERVDVAPLTRAIATVLPYGASLQTRLVKRNLCALLGGETALLGERAGVCDFGVAGAEIRDLPSLSLPDASEQLQQWLDQFYDVQTVVGRSGEARVSLVTPNSAALAFMFEPGQRTAGARLIANLTPFLSSVDRARTVEDALTGGEVFLASGGESRGKPYAFPPTSERDVQFARSQCRQLMQQYGEAVDLHQVLFVAPQLFETPAEFDRRLRTTDLFLQRCAADIANVAQFLALCPPPADDSALPLECQLQLQQLEQRLVRDLQRRDTDDEAWQRWTDYNDYVAGVDREQARGNTVGALVALVRSHMSRHRIAERVAEFVQRQVDALPDGNVLFKDESAAKPDTGAGDDAEARNNVLDRTWTRAYTAGTMASAWFDRLAQLVATNRNAALLVMGAPLVLVLLARLMRDKRPDMLRSVMRASQESQQQLEEQLAGNDVAATLPSAADTLDTLDESQAADLAQDLQRAAALNRQLLDDFERLQAEVARERAAIAVERQKQSRAVKRKAKQLEKMQKAYADLQLAVDNAMTGNNAALALPEARQLFLQTLARGEFDRAETLVRNVVEPDYLENMSRRWAQRLAANDPGAYSRAMDIIQSEDPDERRIERALQRAEKTRESFQNEPRTKVLLASLHVDKQK